MIHTHADDTCTYIHHACNIHAIHTDTYTYMHLSQRLKRRVKRRVKRLVKRRVHMCVYVYVLHVCNVIHTDTYTYMYIHVNTYIYRHIHTHTYTRQSGSGGVFVRQWRLHATPLHSATYPDHLRRGSGRARRARNACGLPIG